MRQQATPTGGARSKSNPLHDHDLSELTKKEILFWSRKLRLTPSELFALSEEELEEHLVAALKWDRDDEARDTRYKRWERLTEMKYQLLKEQQEQRLRGGVDQRSIWEILAQAALEIERIYGRGEPRPCPAASTTCAADETSVNSTFQPNAAMASTPQCNPATGELPTFRNYTPHQPMLTYDRTQTPQGPRLGNSSCPPTNISGTFQSYVGGNSGAAGACPEAPPNVRTQSVPGPNSTCDQSTFDEAAAVFGGYFVGCECGDTFGGPHLPGGAASGGACCAAAGGQTFNRSSTNRTTSAQGSGAGGFGQTFNQSNRSKSAAGFGQTFNQASPNRSISFQPKPVMTSTPHRNPRTGEPASFRNYTDYNMSYSVEGVHENTKSITFEDFDESSGVVRASSRTYFVPRSGGDACASGGNQTFAIRGPSVGAGGATFNCGAARSAAGATFNCSPRSAGATFNRSPTRSPGATFNRSPTRSPGATFNCSPQRSAGATFSCSPQRSADATFSCSPTRSCGGGTFNNSPTRSTGGGILNKSPTRSTGGATFNNSPTRSKGGATFNNSPTRSGGATFNHSPTRSVGATLNCSPTRSVRGATFTTSPTRSAGGATVNCSPTRSAGGGANFDCGSSEDRQMNINSATPTPTTSHGMRRAPRRIVRNSRNRNMISTCVQE